MRFSVMRVCGGPALRRLAVSCAAGVVLAVGGATAPAGAAVIGDFETAALDGWGADGGPGTPTLSQGTLGATLNSSSLKSVNPQGGFWGPATNNLITSHRADLTNAATLSVDVTMIGTQISGDGSAFNGFAQSNELAVTLFSNGGVNVFSQQNWAAAGVSDSLGQNAQWNGVDGTRTLVWNLTKFTGTDPSDGQTKTIAQLLAAHPDIVDAKVAFVEQFGSGVAPGAFYFDNVQLVGSGVPEPASLGLLALAVPALALRRRRA